MNYIDGNEKVNVETVEESKAVESSENKEQENFIYETELSKHSVREPLTKDEKIKLADQMMEVEKEIQHQEGELEFHKSEIKAEIKSLEAKRKNLVEEYRKGTKEILTDCYWRMNYPESGTKTLFRKDKDLVVKSADMNAEDRQMTFKMWQKATGQVVENEGSEEDREELKEEGNVVPQSNEPEDDDENDEDDELEDESGLDREEELRNAGLGIEDEEEDEEDFDEEDDE